MRTRLACTAVLPLLLLPSLAIGQIPKKSPFEAPQLFAFTRSITLPNVRGRIDHMSVDLKGQRLFVAAFDNHTLEVIDLRAGKVVKTLPLDEPQNSVYIHSVNRLFVSSSGDGTVKIFDGTTFALQRTVQLSSDADNMRFDARRNHVLVDYGGEKFLYGEVVGRPGEKDGAVAVLDLDGNKLGQIPTGGHPEALQPEEKGKRIFINSPDNHYIVVADLDTFKVLARWSNPKCENYPMALDEAHHRDFIFCRGASLVSVIDTESGKQVASIRATPLSTSDDMFFDPSKDRLYVIERMVMDPKNDSRGPGTVDVIQEEDPDHYEKIATATTGFAAQTGLFVPTWRRLFVAVPAQEVTGQSAEIREYDVK
jgi:DNA-binding beta-propeller fold protein YncE